ncbi:hypothetical protein [Geomonas sp. Red32]|nr:hypothetical protein [Geomonas sp. Red32]
MRRWVNPGQVHELLHSCDVDGTSRVIMTLLVLKAWKERYLGRS